MLWHLIDPNWGPEQIAGTKGRNRRPDTQARTGTGCRKWRSELMSETGGWNQNPELEARNGGWNQMTETKAGTRRPDLEARTKTRPEQSLFSYGTYWMNCFVFKLWLWIWICFICSCVLLTLFWPIKGSYCSIIHNEWCMKDVHGASTYTPWYCVSDSLINNCNLIRKMVGYWLW